MARGEEFGKTKEGEPVRRLSIEGGGLSAKILCWGAVLQDLRLEGHGAPLVLGYRRLEDYIGSGTYMGAIVGRYANRIRDGHFTLQGERFELDRNALGKHHLHGGSHGFSERLWQHVEAGRNFVTLGLADPAGTMGYPASLDIRCTYRLKARATLAVELEAVADRATLCNLAHHSYFNLDNGGTSDILGHRLMLPAAAYLPIDDEMIPTGVVQPVDGTDFDFRLAREIACERDGAQLRYDHNFCTAGERGPLRLHGWVQGASSLEMEVWSTEPGLQFYAGADIGRPAPGLTGAAYGAFAGLCLEPQIWPDSPNRPYFPQAVLRAGQLYRQVTEYRFRLN